MREYFQVGVITSPHGIRGSVRVYPMSENEKRAFYGKYLQSARLVMDDEGNVKIEIKK